MQYAKHEVQRKTIEDRQQMDELSRIRHSCAHVLATAVLRLWPEAKLDIGPPTEEGFYYDFDLEHRFSPEDFEKIEAEMKKVVKKIKPLIYLKNLAMKPRSIINPSTSPTNWSALRTFPKANKSRFFRMANSSILRRAMSREREM